jgi:hypothetical protein
MLSGSATPRWRSVARWLIERELRICGGLCRMTIEIFYLTAQMQRWLNFQVARHLEAQAAKLKTGKGTVLTTHPMAKLGADGPGGCVGLDRMGMPDGGCLVDETESAVPAAAVCARQSAAQSCHGEKQAVRA